MTYLKLSREGLVMRWLLFIILLVAGCRSDCVGKQRVMVTTKVDQLGSNDFRSSCSATYEHSW